ncbi:LPS assembly lipoprotein LptE [Paragemmobacter straminiformis]|uniref:LPS-assembly lipoprotein n=1 Tax=Paragemmobacter straminiformis TaxID=2045119 RepID=A0A842I952_9RHOB|nr:LPS assembly lipoprotein LptE [Gemmobacter straminiformis]MBC2836146.1 hypothetical protein [Gemmobacter straminiformis]
MSSSDRRQFLILLAALPVAACGFTPAYAPGAGGDRLRGRVAVQAPDSRNEFAFAGRLSARLGQASTAEYTLTYSLRVERVSGGISPANDITRYTLKGEATYTLTENATGTRAAGGTVRNFTSWSATGSTVAGVTAEEAAAERLMTILADDIVARLIAEAP